MRFCAATFLFAFVFRFFGSLSLLSQIITIGKRNISAGKRNPPRGRIKRKVAYYLALVINDIYFLHIYYLFFLCFLTTKPTTATPITNTPPMKQPIQRELSLFGF